MFSWKPTGEIMDKLERSCYEYHYETRKQGPYMCTALMPTATCKSDCTMFETSTNEVLYECSLRDDQPVSDYQGDDPDYDDYNYEDYDDDDYYDQNQEDSDQYPEEVEEVQVEEEEEEPEPPKKKNKKGKKDKSDKKSKKPERAIRYG